MDYQQLVVEVAPDSPKEADDLPFGRGFFQHGVADATQKSKAYLTLGPAENVSLEAVERSRYESDLTRLPDPLQQQVNDPLWVVLGSLRQEQVRVVRKLLHGA